METSAKLKYQNTVVGYKGETMIEFKNDFRIEYTKGDTYALKLTFKNVTQDLTSAIFSVKENADDETALIEKTIGSGISKLDEYFYKNQLVYKLQLQANDSQNLQADNLYLYDLKIAVGNVIKTVISGNFIVRHNVTSIERMTTELLEIEVDDEIETYAETTPATAGIEYEQDPIAMAKIGDITQLNTTAKNNLVSAINEVNTKATASAEEITKIKNGTVSVPEATHATSADSATTATNATKVQNIDLSSGTSALFGDYIVSKKKLLWSDDNGVSISSSGVTDVEICTLSEALSENIKAIEFICEDSANGNYSIKLPLGSDNRTFYEIYTKLGYNAIRECYYIDSRQIRLRYSSSSYNFYGQSFKQTIYFDSSTVDSEGINIKVTKIYGIIE